MVCHLLLRLALCPLLAVGAVSAQARRSAGPTTAEAALAAFAEVASQPESQRQPRLGDVGRFASAEVTAVLLRELAGAESASYRTAVVTQIGQQQREGVLPPLLKLLEDAATTAGLYSALATAIGRQGEAAVPELLRRLEALPGGPQSRAQRGALLRGLGEVRSPAAYTALLAAASRGDDYDRYVALQNLAKAPETKELTAARLDAVRSSYELLRMEALRQLADAGHAEAKALALKVFKSLKPTSAATHMARLAEVFAGILDSDTFEPFVVCAAAAHQSSGPLIERVARQADGCAGFVAWLLEKGLKREVPAERVVAFELLTGSQDPAVGDALLALVASKDPGMSLLAIRALGARGDQRAVPMLRRAAQDPGRRTEAILGLHALLKQEPAWREELVGMLGAADVDQRVVAIDLLAELAAEEVLPRIHGELGHKAWQVRAAAYDFCRLVRSLASVEPLIARVDVEEGRLREDCLDALKAITSYRLESGARWRGWWDGVKHDFRMPTVEQALGKQRSRAAASTISFFDIPLVSTRVIFVIDHSGSMSAEVGTAGKSGAGRRTRLEEAKRQLTNSVQGLPDDAVFNLVYFGTTVKGFEKKSVRATKAAKSSAVQSVAKLTPTGGTNIHDALALAFEDETVDTIYLLSDGSPSAGKIRDPDELATAVAQWNKTRRIRIHTIAVGSKSAFMERLARESGGMHSRTD